MKKQFTVKIEYWDTNHIKRNVRWFTEYRVEARDENEAWEKWLEFFHDENEFTWLQQASVRRVERFIEPR